jgi:steroid delta-isomerase
MQAYVEKITAGDLDGVVAVCEFSTMACESVGRMELEGNPRVRGSWGACAMLAYPKGAEDALVIETLDVMSFDEAGKITSMKAFWGDSNMREL